MCGVGSRWSVFRLIAAVLIGQLVLVTVFVLAEPSLKEENKSQSELNDVQYNYKMRVLTQKIRSGYEHVWPDMEFGWKIVLGTIIGFFGAACGSVGGVGGGGILVPMLTLIIGFDSKSSAALSKCMITGASAAAVFCNLRKRHPTLELPVIDYDLALLFQPMLVLGVSVGVAFNVIFADWMITILLITLFTVMSTKSFLKGVETWRKETVMKEEAAKRLGLNGNGGQVESRFESESLSNTAPEETKETKRIKVSIIENVYWKELGILIAVWVIILALQIAKNHAATCSVQYWALNFLQVPVAGGVSAYEAVCLYNGQRKITSKGEVGTKWRVQQLILYCGYGVMAGVLGGLLGLGGGFILGPLLLELEIPPQVSSATTTFVMTFSASMSVIEYYLLKRFPVPYALYLLGVATIAAIAGQHVVQKLISILGRASIIIFVLSITIFVSALSLGGVGIGKMIERIQQKKYMGFDNICSYAT